MILQLKITWFLTAVNILLLLIAIVISVRSYMKMKAQYTIMIIALASLFLLQNLVSGYYFLTMMDFYVPDVSTHIMILSILQTIAFLTLLWMEWQ